MKKSYITILGIIVIALLAGLIMVSVQSQHKFAFVNTAETVHKELVSAKQFVTPDEAQAMLSATDKKPIFIDVRNPRKFDNFHLPNSINIPMQQVLDEQYKPLWNNGELKVLFGTDTRQADQVRTLLIQFGYTNVSVLHGGSNYWKQNMINSGPFTSKAEYDDEKLNAEALKSATGK
jgi:rhodanese-related sulfurtransferase